MWRETYDASLAGGGCAAEKLLAAVKASVDAEPSAETMDRLSAIGRELVLPLSELLAMDRKTARQTRLGIFKLQLVTRLLLCCEDGAFVAQDEQEAPRRKAKATGKKKMKKRTKMSLQQELRQLLDRVALLVEAAHPASIGDSEDDPSPFHFFLVNVLEKQLGDVIPHVFSYLRQQYELVNDADEEHTPIHSTQTALKAATPSKVDPIAVSTNSILSALRDERPSKKRSLAATSDAFKEVSLPGQGSKVQSSTVKRAKSSKNVEHVPRNPLPAASKAPTRRALDSSLGSLAAASKRSRSSPSHKALANSMPMLIRNVDRKVLPVHVPGARGATPIGGSTAPARNNPGALLRPPPQHQNGPKVNQPPRTSIVMRTPDRPLRQQRSQPRILVEASPPLRNPFASARIRRTGSQLPK